MYILQNSINLTNGIHEYGHFLIAAVSRNNPSLLSKLLHADFISSPEGAQIDTEVRKTYTDFEENGIQQEVITRGLTALAENQIVNPKTQNIFTRLWYAIKQILRNTFGKEVKLQNLDEHTFLIRI